MDSSSQKCGRRGCLKCPQLVDINETIHVNGMLVHVDKHLNCKDKHIIYDYLAHCQICCELPETCNHDKYRACITHDTRYHTECQSIKLLISCQGFTEWCVGFHIAYHVNYRAYITHDMCYHTEHQTPLTLSRVYSVTCRVSHVFCSLIGPWADILPLITALYVIL